MTESPIGKTIVINTGPRGGIIRKFKLTKWGFEEVKREDDNLIFHCIFQETTPEDLPQSTYACEDHAKALSAHYDYLLRYSSVDQGRPCAVCEGEIKLSRKDDKK